jgi:outer membrane protein assembly factor BamE
MKKLLIHAFIALILTACAHKIDIQQGNVISEEKLSQLQQGMDQHQVRLLIGTPMLIDPFHPERWDYYYSMKPGREPLIRYRATLFFDNGRLSRIERAGPIPEKENPQLEKKE